jgi:hypothetical protein
VIVVGPIVVVVAARDVGDVVVEDNADPLVVVVVALVLVLVLVLVAVTRVDIRVVVVVVVVVAAVTGTLHRSSLQQQTRCPLNVAAHVELAPLDPT